MSFEGQKLDQGKRRIEEGYKNNISWEKENYVEKSISKKWRVRLRKRAELAGEKALKQCWNQATAGRWQLTKEP